MIWISFGKWNTSVKWRGDLRIRKRRIRTQRGRWTPFVLYDFEKYPKGGNRGDADDDPRGLG